MIESLLQKPSVNFLEKNEELFMIGLPIVGGLLTLAFWGLGVFGIAFGIGDIAMMMAALLLMDGVHIIFTYVLISSLPELKQWTKLDKTRSTTGWAKGMGPMARSAIIAVALGAIIWVLKISPATATLRGMATTFLLLELVGPAQHTVAQMRGISLCYNSSIRRNCKLTESELKQAMLCEKLERWFFTALLVGEIGYWIPYIFRIDNYIIPRIEQIQTMGGAVSIASAAAIIVNSLYFPRQEESKKFAFITRVALFPMKMLTTIGGIALRAAHGTEYLIIFRRMVKGAEITEAKKKGIFKKTILICAAYAVLFVMTSPYVLHEMTGVAVSDRFFGIALLIVFTLRFTHYYLDSVLFKMSDPATRGVVAPLLITTPTYNTITKESAPLLIPGLATNLKDAKKKSKKLETVG